MLNDAGIHDLVIVTGYHKERIKSLIGDRAQYFNYPDFTTTNNLYTLRHCRELLDRPTVLMFSDVVVEYTVLDGLLSARSEFVLLVDTSKNRPGTMRIRLDRGSLTDIGQNVLTAGGHGNFIGIMAMSAQGALRLKEELEDMAQEGGFMDHYYTKALPRLVRKGATLKIQSVAGVCWFEVDTISDYFQALFKVRYLDKVSMTGMM